MILFLPDWLTIPNAVIGIFMFVMMVVGGLILLRTRNKSEIEALQLARAVAAEGLVKTRDAEIESKDKRIKELEEELEGLAAEHRTLVGISIAKLMEFQAQRDTIEAEIADLERQVRVLKLRKDGDT